jgi:pimeloyl-ACP methyl ester carboxylesterase
MQEPSRRAFVHVEGTDVHWLEMGTGKPLVLLHGLSDYHGTWSRAAAKLAETRRVIMPDLPGHGYSSRPEASYALDWYAKVMSAWVDALELDEFDLTGHSFGGGVAQWLLLHARKRVRRVCLVAPGGLGPDVGLALRLCAATNLVERVGQPFMGVGTRIGMKQFKVFDAKEIDLLSWLNARPGSARVLSRTVRDVIDWRGQYRHFLDRAHEVTDLPPLLLVWGDKDPIIPHVHAETMRSYVDGVDFVRFDDCGHFPHRQRPEAFVETLSAFLEAPHYKTPLLRRERARATRKRRPELRVVEER